ncbi:protein of unknown function DUF262 [Dehalogenimonas lykanthroporepellens BL-DC-9]|nr:protein of unknown function DUF262 [Dehalogenimonas lykanthroporepellens BL-DC-9]
MVNSSNFNPERQVIDEASKDDTVVPIKYEITSFGADYDAEGLVKRLIREDIYIPPFQRAYVWNINEASRFIESLLLGLPVPGIFLAKESESNKLLVIDGQQRLKSLEFFFKGYFQPDPETSSRRVFRLSNVQKKYLDKTYDTLDPSDKVALNDSIIHATIVKQESPREDDSSIYHIFERLNNTGRKLAPQQIRVAIDHGDFVDTLHELNNEPNWRTIFGSKSLILKDQELILRFLALYFEHETYFRPMEEFLNQFSRKHRHCSQEFCTEASTIFKNTVSLINETVGKRAFRTKAPRALNAAVFDSVMVGLAKRISSNTQIDKESVVRQYSALLQNNSYRESVEKATSNENSVKTRIDIAIRTFQV